MAIWIVLAMHDEQTDLDDDRRPPERQRSFSGGASPEPWDLADEVSDDELLECMTRAGCFDWLLDPAENIYTLGDGELL